MLCVSPKCSEGAARYNTNMLNKGVRTAKGLRFNEDMGAAGKWCPRWLPCSNLKS